MPAFQQVLVAIAEAYATQRDDVAKQAAALVDALRAQRAQRRRRREPLTDELLDRGRATRCARSTTRSGAASAARRSSRPRRRSSSCCAAARSTSRSARSTACARAACTTSSAAASTATRSTRSGSCRTSRRCSTTTRCSSRRTCTRGSLTGEERYRAIVEETLDYVLRELRLDGGGFASAQDADTDGVEGLTFTWTPRRGRRATELLQPFEHGRYIIRGQLTDDERAALLAAREQRPQPLRDDKAIAAWNGLMLAALAEAGRRLERADWLDAARELARVPARPALRRRAAAPHLARRRREGHRLPRGLRERRARALRAARRDRRPALAARVAPARAARGRALRRRRERRLLPHARRRRGARRAAEGSRRQPDAVGQLDARVRAAPPRAALGRRRARAARGRRAAARSATRSRARRRRSAGRSARSTCTSRRRASSRSSATRRARSPAPRSRGFDPNAVVAFGPATACRCSRARRSSTGKPAVYVCERFACRAPVTDPAASCR